MSQNSRSRSIPIIEAPVAMSNPIWKIFTRASDLYRIFRRSSKPHAVVDPDTVQPDSISIGNGSKSSSFRVGGDKVSSRQETEAESSSPEASGSKTTVPKEVDMNLSMKKIQKNPRGWRLFLK